MEHNEYFEKLIGLKFNHFAKISGLNASKIKLPPKIVKLNCSENKLIPRYLFIIFHITSYYFVHVHLVHQGIPLISVLLVQYVFYCNESTTHQNLFRIVGDSMKLSVAVWISRMPVFSVEQKVPCFWLVLGAVEKQLLFHVYWESLVKIDGAILIKLTARC